MKMKPGKLYKVINSGGINACKEEQLDARSSIIVPMNKIFLFIETIEKDLGTFSKILLDDKVMITYNGYLLAKDIVELVQE